MLTTPVFETRQVQNYAYINFTVPVSEMNKPADEGFPELLGWLAQHGIRPLAAPFFNYRRIDMAKTLDVEAGVPVDPSNYSSDRILFGQLPAGRYVTATHTGHFSGLYEATAKLISWLSDNDVQLDMMEHPDGDHFACRLEIYDTDPGLEPDPSKWVTRLVFKVKEQGR